MKRVLFAGLLCAILGVTGLVAAERGSVTNIDVPRASGTFPLSINDYGDVVGYCEIEGKIHGFILKNGTFTTLDIPPLPNPVGFVHTIITGINNRGDVAGYYLREQEGVYRSFIYSKGAFTSLEFPGVKDTIARGINDLGDVVGIINQGSFLYSQGTFSRLPVPGGAVGINNKRQIVGYYSDLDSHQAFIYQDGEFTMIPTILDAFANIPWGINDHGDVVLTGDVSSRMVIYSKGRLNAVHIPQSPVWLGGINNAGEIVGVYRSPEGEHAYVGHLKGGDDRDTTR
jgi:probable HAF family extracellular repeat protein